MYEYDIINNFSTILYNRRAVIVVIIVIMIMFFSYDSSDVDCDKEFCIF